MASSTYFRTLQGAQLCYSWVTFGNGETTFFICQTGSGKSYIYIGGILFLPDRKRYPSRQKGLEIFKLFWFWMSFFWVCLFGFQPFWMLYESWKKTKHQSFLVVLFTWHQWLALGLHKFQFGGFQDLDHGSFPAKRKTDNFPGKLLTFWMNRLMSLTKIFGERGAFKVLFAPNLYCWFSTCKVAMNFVKVLLLMVQKSTRPPNMYETM